MISLKKDFKLIYDNVPDVPLEMLYWYHHASKKDRKLYRHALFYKTKALKEKDSVFSKHVKAFINDEILSYHRPDDGIVSKFLKFLSGVYCYFFGPKKLKPTNNDEVDLALVARDNLFFNNLRSNYIVNEAKKIGLENWKDTSEADKLSFGKKISKYVETYKEQNSTKRISIKKIQEMSFNINGSVIKGSELLEQIKKKGNKRNGARR